ncbi:MAG: PRC-barrel domain containing protein [Actinomycetota bacterium]|jgi:hypothetical protein|nr:PRC-barrel domain containing protein [Actinomycetota bacterium]
MTQPAAAPEDMFGRVALDRNGGELGTIEGIYLDRSTQEPEWAAVRTGREETTIVPLAGAAAAEDGVRLPLEAELVRGAPGTHGPLPPEVPAQLEAELYHYYSLDYSGAGLGGDPSEDHLPSGPANAS